MDLDQHVAHIYELAGFEPLPARSVIRIAERLFGPHNLHAVDGTRTFAMVSAESWRLYLGRASDIEAVVLATSDAIASWYLAGLDPATAPDLIALARAIALPSPTVRLYRDQHSCSVEEIAERLHVPIDVARARCAAVPAAGRHRKREGSGLIRVASAAR